MFQQCIRLCSQFSNCCGLSTEVELMMQITAKCVVCMLDRKKTQLFCHVIPVSHSYIFRSNHALLFVVRIRKYYSFNLVYFLIFSRIFAPDQNLQIYVVQRVCNRATKVLLSVYVYANIFLLSFTDSSIYFVLLGVMEVFFSCVGCGNVLMLAACLQIKLSTIPLF